jgi:hypothetical protein
LNRTDLQQLAEDRVLDAEALLNSDRGGSPETLPGCHRHRERSTPMDQASLLTEEIDAGAELVRRLEKTLPVQAAFWVKDAEGGPWYLYLASDQVRRGKLDAGYREVLRLTWEMASPYFDALQVKLVPTSHLMAQAALEINQRFPRRIPTRFGGRSFGGTAVDGVYVYPTSLPSDVP